MTRKLTLRLREADARALDDAAIKIAGPAGARYVGRTEIIRKALADFNARPDEAKQEARQ